ncbi:MAG: alpha-hydroxy-acid oxidizing protein [Candidatus Muiribacteriota bacterium]
MKKHFKPLQLKQKKYNIFKNKCFNCNLCNGIKCAGIIPGMGAVGNGVSFINNFNSWENIVLESKKIIFPLIGVAPMTGVDENMGGGVSEREFHKLIINGAQKANIFSCIGDGTPDYKMFYGLEALKENRQNGFVFIKPYSQEKIFKRLTFLNNYSKGVGIDIDAVTLKTMSDKDILETKSAKQLIEIKKKISLPFIIKGISDYKDLELVKRVKPFAAVVSNHGGRISDKQTGIAYVLKKLAPELKKYCEEIWVDGGIRFEKHLIKAASLGANRVLIGRPFAIFTLLHKENGIKRFLDENMFCV